MKSNELNYTNRSTLVTWLALHVAVIVKQPPFQLSLVLTMSTLPPQPTCLHTLNRLSSKGKNTITLGHLMGSSESEVT